MTSPEFRITPEERKRFDMLGITLASMLSFGEASPEMDVAAEDIRSDAFCFFDAKDFPENTLVGDRWDAMLNPFLCLRTEPHEGRKVEALTVRWINTFDAEKNPFCDTGFFLARAYSLSNTEP